MRAACASLGPRATNQTAVAMHSKTRTATTMMKMRTSGASIAEDSAHSIEVGTQNSALALVLILGFFDGLGGMAIIATQLGVWHLISGLTVATYRSKRPVPNPEA